MKGSYILVISLKNDNNIEIGKLGSLFFKKGFYFYVGSAMGASGSTTLINRVKRHVSTPDKKKIHWHIDYLLQNKEATITRLYLIPCGQKLECVIAKELFAISNGFIESFGCSDCKCKSHLFYFNEFKDLFLKC